MQNTKLNESVTRGEFLKETGQIRESVNNIARRILKIEDDISGMKDSMATKMATKKDVHTILSAIDSFMRKSENYDRKAVFHDARLLDHESRIARLEKTSSS